MSAICGSELAAHLVELRSDAQLGRTLASHPFCIRQYCVERSSSLILRQLEALAFEPQANNERVPNAL